MGKGRYRGRMRSEVLIFFRIIKEVQGASIEVEELARRMDISIAGAYRWIDAMRGCVDIEIRSRVLYVPLLDENLNETICI